MSGLKFALHGVLVLAFNFAVLVGIQRYINAGISYEPWDTYAVLWQMPTREHMDLVTLGSSHGAVFTDTKVNREFLTDELGLKVCGLSQRSGGGIKPAFFMLEEFYQRHNSAENLIYFLEPFVLFTREYNDRHLFVEREPFYTSIFFSLIYHGYPAERIYIYARSKLDSEWIFKEPHHLIERKGVAKNAGNEEYIEERIAGLYTDGLQEEIFLDYANYLEEIFQMCQAHGTRVLLIVPPTLLGHEPGHARMEEYLESVRDRYTFEYYDFTNIYDTRDLFYDIDHLNWIGVKRFAKERLMPLLSPTENPAQKIAH